MLKDIATHILPSSFFNRTTQTLMQPSCVLCKI